MKQTPWYWEAEVVIHGDYSREKCESDICREWSRIFGRIEGYSGIELLGSANDVVARLYLSQRPNEEHIAVFGHSPHQCMYSYWPMVINGGLGSNGSVRVTRVGSGVQSHVRLVLDAVKE